MPAGDVVLPCPPIRHIALDDGEFDHGYSDTERDWIIAGWKAGASIPSMAEDMRRDPDEILVIALDLARRGKIRRRRGGVLGEGDEG